MPDECDERASVEAGLDRLKIFPLPSSVLLPGGHLHFHLFEPRYREMIEACLERDRVLAIALLAPGWEAGYYERPPVHPVVGVGYVQEDERLDDGRHNILLHGVTRARITEEHEATACYREVRAEVLEDTRSDASDLTEGSLRLRQLVLELATRIDHEGVTSLARACAGEAHPGRLADLVGAATFSEAADRQQMLEQRDVAQRLDLASGRVAELLLDTVQPAGEAPMAEPQGTAAGPVGLAAGPEDPPYSNSAMTGA